jgi:drug/metabolite transporter (DMT)-like permease
VAAALLFSTGGAGIKAEAFSAAQVSTVRSAVAAVALLLWLRGRLVWSPAALWVGAIYAAMLTLFVAATKLTTAANAIFLQSTAPVYIILLGPFLLRERVSTRDLPYIGLIAAGLVLCFAGQTSATATAPDPTTGNLLALVCSVTWALTLMSLRHLERDPRPAFAPSGLRRDRQQGVGLTAVVAGNALAAAVALPWAWPFPAATPSEWATVAYLGVFQIGLAYVCLTSAIGHLPALEVSLLLLIEPVFNPLWTWLIRDEQPGAWALAGGGLILAATAMKTLRDARSATKT